MRPQIPPRRPQKTATSSCKVASTRYPLRKFAGYNAAADLLGLPQAPFAPTPYATCLDLGAAGAVATNGWDREVQMTGNAAKTLKQQINAEWIYPPLDEAEAILKHADYHQTWPTAEIFG
jgi:NADH dehydrogenase